MLKNLFYSFTILISLTSNAQVGINTSNPQGVFHINSTPNNPTNTSTADDVVISTNTGNVAIGHTSPDTKLDIRTNGTISVPVPGFKLVDGNQADGRVLHTNASGVATWEDIIIFNKAAIVGNFTWSSTNTLGNTNWNSIANLTIPPGTHMIYIKVHMLSTPNSGFLRTYVGNKNLNTNNSNASDTPILGSTNFQPYMSRDFEMTQSFVYTNTTTGNITLYFNIQSDSNAVRRSNFTYPATASFLGVNLNENYFLSIPAN